MPQRGGQRQLSTTHFYQTRIAAVTHKRLLTLILKHFDPKSGFEDWRKLTTSDGFRMEIKENESQVDRIWQ